MKFATYRSSWSMIGERPRSLFSAVFKRLVCAVYQATVYGCSNAMAPPMLFIIGVCQFQELAMRYERISPLSQVARSVDVVVHSRVRIAWIQQKCIVRRTRMMRYAT